MHILLVTDVPPCMNYTAGLVETTLCQFLLDAGHTISCVEILDASLTPKMDENLMRRFFATEIFTKPFEGYGRRTGGHIWSLFGNTYHRQWTLPRLAEQAAERLKQNGVRADLLWCLIQGQTMIEIVPLIAKKCGVPYVVQIADPPEWWLRENRFDSISYRAVMAHFDELLRQSQCCLAASFPMATEYHKMYGTRCVPILPSLPATVPHSFVKREKKTFSIGFSGQIYARDAFGALLRTLDRMGWTYAGKPIQLHCFSNYIASEMLRGRDNLKSYGWIEQNELLRLLSKMDLCYCPYPFSSDFSVVARLSFPAKLTTYLSLGVPVFIHAPRDASISVFLENDVSGYICHEMETGGIEKKLRQILQDENRGEVGRMGYEKFLRFLTHETMRRSFFDALGLPERWKS